MLADKSSEIQAEVEAWQQAQRDVEVKEQGDDDKETCRLVVANKYHK